MLLDIDKLSPLSVIAIDSDDERLTQSDVTELSRFLKTSLPERSLLFILTENNIGGIAWVLAALLSGNVPLILSAHTESSLLKTLTDTYLPQYICAPSKTAEEIKGRSVADRFGY